jgi:ABC-type glycerol-3-phosphate transport system substrate-binding protein
LRRAPEVEVGVLKMLRLVCALLLASAWLAGCHDDSSSMVGTDSTSSPTGASAGAATLSWQAPTTDTNGEPLTNLSGYVIYYGASQTDLSQTIKLNTVGMQTYVIDNLTAGTWYFAIRAMTSSGAESGLSDIVSKTIS